MTHSFAKARSSAMRYRRCGRDRLGVSHHNYVVRGNPYLLRPVAKLKEPTSGRVMTLAADQPGVQFYTGNFMDGSLSGKATTYQQYAMLCLETQRFPNSINVPAWRDQVILKPGQPYVHTMVETFTTE